MKEFKNKKILLSPHSPMTNALEKYLSLNGIEIVGFIDKNKEGNKIFKIQTIDKESFDEILILSPNHFNVIYNEYIQYIKPSRILQVIIKDAKYFFERNIRNTAKKFAYEPRELNIKRSKIVFISKDFVSSNNKALFLYLVRNNIDTVILTNNIEQIEELKSFGLNYKVLDTKEADYEIAIAKYIIFDQANYTYLPKLHPEQKTIQLWHGVGLKDMSRIDNIKYDYFISTSHWTNETSFKNTFVAKEFLNCGYPRNDILLQNKENKYDTLFCDNNIMEFIKNTDGRLILYAPTHRESNPIIPLDFKSLNEQLKDLNFTMIIKFHPFVLKYYDNNSSISYSNIKFHNANGDIYPILKYFDILISDYSSIVYDFLLLDRPIIFFNYDIEEYTQNMPLLFDYDEYSPGQKVKTHDELIQAIQKKDSYKKERKKIKSKFFDLNLNMACENILNFIKETI